MYQGSHDGVSSTLATPTNFPGAQGNQKMHEEINQSRINHWIAFNNDMDNGTPLKTNI